MIKFSNSRNKSKRAVRLNGLEILRSDNFGYLRSIIHKDVEIEEDVNSRIRARWMKRIRSIVQL